MNGGTRDTSVRHASARNSRLSRYLPGKYLLCGYVPKTPGNGTGGANKNPYHKQP